MEDKREDILARLPAVAATIFGGEDHVFRNTLEIPEGTRPACVILDGDEEADESGYGKGRPAHGPAIVTMRPEIHIILGDVADDVGTVLNDYRRELVKAIITDASLVATCLHGDIRFEAFSTGLAAGRNMEAQGRLDMSFRYVLRPEKLTD